MLDTASLRLYFRSFCSTKPSSLTLFFRSSKVTVNFVFLKPTNKDKAAHDLLWASWGVVMLVTEVDFTGMVLSCLIQLVLNSSVATHIVADVLLTGKYSSFIPSCFKLLFKIHHDSIKYKHSLVPRPIRKIGERAWYPLFAHALN